MKKIGFTGHRNLIDESKIREEIQQSLLYFKESIGDFSVISSLAIGADTIFVQECIKLKISIQIELPFELDSFLIDFTPIQKKIANEILTHNLCNVSYSSRIVPKNTIERNKLYFENGITIVNNSDCILAVWDGKESSGLGGTEDVIKYAKKQNKPIYIINGYKVKNLVLENFNRLDNETLQTKEKQFKPTWKLGLLLGYLAIVLFSLNLAFSQLLSHTTKYIVGLFEFFCLLTSSLLLLLFARKFHKKYIESRVNAESLRTNWILSDLGISKNKATILEIIPNKHEPTNLNDSKRKLWVYITEQINYHKDKRVDEFESNEVKIEELKKILKWLFFLNFGSKLVLESYLFFNHSEPSEFQSIILMASTFFSLLIPSAYATIEGISYFEDYKSNIEISKRILNKLTQLKIKLLGIETEEQLLYFTNAVVETLNSENHKWKERYKLKEIDVKF